MANPNIRRDVDNDQVSMQGGSDWDRGAMLQLGGNSAGGDIANGSAQILMNDFSSRFRVRERSAWRDGLTVYGNGRIEAPYATETTNDNYLMNLGGLRGVFATGTPVYVESDPSWSSSSNRYLRLEEGGVVSGPLTVSNALTATGPVSLGTNVVLQAAVVVGSNVTAAVAGMIRWNPGTGNFEGYTGTGWITLGNVYAD